MVTSTRTQNRRALLLLACVFVATAGLLLSATAAFAADPTFVALEPLPNLSQTSVTDIGGFVSNLLRALIGIGGFIAVFMLTLGGVQYMTSETLGMKEAGKERMQSAIWGLLLLISAVLILYVINPDLLNFNLAPQTVTVNTSAPSPGAIDGGNTIANRIIAEGTPTAPGTTPAATKVASQLNLDAWDATAWNYSTASAAPNTAPSIKEVSEKDNVGSSPTVSLTGKSTLELLAAQEDLIKKSEAVPGAGSDAYLAAAKACQGNNRVLIRFNPTANTYTCL